MDVVIVSATRTAIGKFLGQFSVLTAPQLAAATIKESLKRVSLKPGDANEVIMGNAISAGIGQNPARQAAINSGIPNYVPTFTVNKVCGSGLKAVMLAAQSIKAGENEIVVAGGMESMSQAPHLLREGRKIKKYGDITKQELLAYAGDYTLTDSMVYDGLWCAFNLCHMGDLAENLVKKEKISRQRQDEYSLRSHRLAVEATDRGTFKKEIVPIKINGKNVDIDEGPRRDTSLEKMAQLKTVFKGNTITAGNSSQLSDGASALIVMSKDKAKELGLKPLVTIEHYAQASTDPSWYTVAPVSAVKHLMLKYKYKIGDFDLIELNEAYAAQNLKVIDELKIDTNRLNVNGGAIALGHPIGCSGARILTTLIYSMIDRKKKLGLATLCIGGGEAIAMSVSR